MTERNKTRLDRDQLICLMAAIIASRGANEALAVTTAVNIAMQVDQRSGAGLLG